MEKKVVELFKVSWIKIYLHLLGFALKIDFNPNTTQTAKETSKYHKIEIFKLLSNEWSLDQVQHCSMKYSICLPSG